MDALTEQIVKRFTHKREIGVPLNKRGEMNDIENEIESGFAEKYACEYFGCKFNADIFDGGDPGYDFYWDNLKIDAKWLGVCKNGSPRNSGRIIVDVGKLNADVYVAVAGSRAKGFRLVGWCTDEELVYSPWFTTKYQDKHGRQIRYAIHSDELHPIELLTRKE